jgi:hypothetical protein
MMTADAGAAGAQPQEPAFLADLLKAMKKDKSAPFAVDTVMELAKLQREHRQQFEHAREAIRKAGCKRMSKLQETIDAVEFPDDAVDEDDDDDRGEDGAKESQAVRLVKVVGPLLELFHVQDGGGYAIAKVGQHKEVIKIESPDGKKMIGRLYYEETKQIPQRDAISSAQGHFEHQAKYDSPERKTYLRTAGHNGKFYIDLCNVDRQVIEIGPSGYVVISGDSAPVLFIRKSGMRPLPYPTPGGKIEKLKEFLNLADENAFRLFVAALTYAYRPIGPYPLVGLYGEHGSAKSTAAIVFRRLIDPSVSELRTMPKNPDDLFVQALNAWLQIFDNVSKIPHETSDAMCRMLTGGGLGKRMLYTDNDQVLVDIMRPAIVTSIPDIAERPDLADRSVMLGCVPIARDKRKTEGDFWKDFSAARASLFGAVLDIVVEGIRNMPTASKANIFRMADFHQWGRAIEGMNGGEGTFDKAYTANREAAVEVIISSDVVALSICKLMNEAKLDETDYRRWSGTATTLRNELLRLAGDAAKHDPEFPKNARAASTTLRRLLPTLRQVGITTKKDRLGKESAKIISLAAHKVGKFATFASDAPAENDNSNDDKDLEPDQGDMYRAQNAEGGRKPADGGRKSEDAGRTSGTNTEHAQDGANGFNGHDNPEFSGASGASGANFPTSRNGAAEDDGLPEQDPPPGGFETVL